MSTRCKACDIELFGEYLDDELCATCMSIALDLVPDQEKISEIFTSTFNLWLWLEQYGMEEEEEYEEELMQW